MGNSPAKLTPGRQWADAPFKLLKSPKHRDGLGGSKPESPASAAATEMVLVHNMIIRGLNSIVLQAKNIKEEKDITDFLTYMYSWSLLVHMHHDNEESTAFPMLEKDIGIEGYMDKNVDQHKLFGPGLTAFDEFVAAVKGGKENYDGKKVCEIIDSFGGVFTQHLTEEIGTLEELEKFGDKINWPVWNKALQDKAVNEGDKEYELPFGICNLDVTYESPTHGKHPLLPWIAKLMFRWLYIPKHKSAWRFASCDDRGRPKDLPFV